MEKPHVPPHRSLLFLRCRSHGCSRKLQDESPATFADRSVINSAKHAKGPSSTTNTLIVTVIAHCLCFLRLLPDGKVLSIAAEEVGAVCLYSLLVGVIGLEDFTSSV